MTDTTILHISDIHAGATTFKDMDGKAEIEGASVAKPLKLLSTYLEALPRIPDFVVVSGDITIKGDQGGLEEFRAWLLKESAAGVLPPIERILVVPGNHDVTRRSRVSESGLVQFRNFWQVFGRAFTHATIPDFDPVTKTPIKLPAGAKRLGGIRVGTVAGEVKLKSSLPYILDLTTDILIYGFNSAHGCGIPLKPKATIEGKLNSLIELSNTDTAKTLSKIREDYLDSLVVDAGMLTEGQIAAFNQHMKALRKALGGRFENLTKVAVLHHHVGHLWQQQLEVKVFEAVVEAAQFKQALTENAFDIVLHGHKHANHVGIDGTLIPVDRTDRFNPLCVISGGTIGGLPRTNDHQSFKLVELPGTSGPRRTAVVREVPLLPVNVPSDVISKASRVYNLPITDRFPSLHDIATIKNSLDQELTRQLAPELAAGADVAASGATLNTSVDSLFASTFPSGSFSSLIFEGIFGIPLVADV